VPDEHPTRFRIAGEQPPIPVGTAVNLSRSNGRGSLHGSSPSGPARLPRTAGTIHKASIKINNSPDVGDAAPVPPLRELADLRDRSIASDQGEASRASQPPHTVLLPPPTLVGSSRSAARRALAAAFGAFDAEHIELTCDVAKDEVSARHWLTQRYFSRCDIRHSLACVSGLVYPCGAQRHPR
jgi:hypothetical protein